jgi:hypothetical protein
MRNSRQWFVVVGVVVAVAACGAEQPQPMIPPPAPAPTGEESSDPSWDTGEARPVESEAEPEPAAKPADEELKQPEFTPGMSVNEAISAVPSYYDYVGLDQEVLAKPLTNPDTYKECKVAQNDRFKVRIAVWNGKVVGADVEAPPAKKDCIDRVVRAIEYKEQVESINTVEYSF